MSSSQLLASFLLIVIYCIFVTFTSSSIMHQKKYKSKNIVSIVFATLFGILCFILFIALNSYGQLQPKPVYWILILLGLAISVFIWTAFAYELHIWKHNIIMEILSVLSFLFSLYIFMWGGESPENQIKELGNKIENLKQENKTLNRQKDIINSEIESLQTEKKDQIEFYESGKDKDIIKKNEELQNQLNENNKLINEYKINKKVLENEYEIKYNEKINEYQNKEKEELLELQNKLNIKTNEMKEYEQNKNKFETDYESKVKEYEHEHTQHKLMQNEKNEIQKQLNIKINEIKEIKNILEIEYENKENEKLIKLQNEKNEMEKQLNIKTNEMRENETKLNEYEENKNKFESKLNEYESKMTEKSQQYNTLVSEYKIIADSQKSQKSKPSKQGNEFAKLMGELKEIENPPQLEEDSKEEKYQWIDGEGLPSKYHKDFEDDDSIYYVLKSVEYNKNNEKTREKIKQDIEYINLNNKDEYIQPRYHKGLVVLLEPKENIYACGDHNINKVKKNNKLIKDFNNDNRKDNKKHTDHEIKDFVNSLEYEKPRKKYEDVTRFKIKISNETRKVEKFKRVPRALINKNKNLPDIMLREVKHENTIKEEKKEEKKEESGRIKKMVFKVYNDYKQKKDKEKQIEEENKQNVFMATIEIPKIGVHYLCILVLQEVN